MALDHAHCAPGLEMVVSEVIFFNCYFKKMDTSLIVVVTGLLQIAGTIVITKIQKNQIAGLRNSIDDQKAAIEALKTQAEGQVMLTNQQQALTSQMSQLMTGVLSDAEKRLAIVKETAALETGIVQQKLEQAQAKFDEQRAVQLKSIEGIHEQPAMTEMLKRIIDDNYNFKEHMFSMQTQINNFLLKAEIIFESIVSVNSAALLNEDDITLFPSLTQIQKNYIKAVFMRAYVQKPAEEPLIINYMLMGIHNYFYNDGKGSSVSYKEMEAYVQTLGLGPFQTRA